MSEGIVGYPSHQIDPKNKGYEFILQYIKAAWSDANGNTPLGFYWRGVRDYNVIKDYARAEQSIDKYKETPLKTDITDTTNLNKDFTPLAILPKFREIMISKLFQRQITLEAQAVDPLAKSEEDKYFNEMKIKIMMRQMLQQAGSPLANSPILAANPGEPEDMDALQMQMDFGYKHILAMEAELGLKLIQERNNMDALRLRTIEELVDAGLGGYKEWIDENGEVRFREVIAKNLVTSFCLKSDFSDAQHIGELQLVMLADIAKYFTPLQIDEICKKTRNQWGNPRDYYPYMSPGTNWKLFRVQVLDFEFFSWNTTVYKNEIDKRGNNRFLKSDYKNIQFLQKSNTYVLPDGSVEQLPSVPEEDKGEATPKYKDLTRKVIYKTKWIVNSDYMYDYGLAQNMGRKNSNWRDTKLSYHLQAWNFYEMKYVGLTKRLIPIADAYQQTWLKLQDLKKKLLPYLIYLDLDAMDSAALGKSGLGMTAKELIDFMFTDGVLAYRSSGGISNNPNYKPGWIEATGQLAAFPQLYQDLLNCVQMMYEISGLNQATANSPDPKMLTTGLQLANESTNNAIFLVSNADKALQVRLADALILKLQISVKIANKEGKRIEGYVKALGRDSLQFLSINPDVSLHEFGIYWQDVMTAEQKQELYQQINLKDSQGILSIADRIQIESCQNMKQAMILLDYKVKKGQELAHQRQMELVQQQNMGNMQVAQATEQAKQQTLQLQHQLEMERLQVQLQGQYMIEAMKKQGDNDSASIQAQAKVFGHQIDANAKLATSVNKSI